jgi:acylphosphatase
MSTEEREARRGFRVRGRVQGVGFRWWTQRTAERLGVGGSVRNMPDGSVEVQAVGRAKVLAELERALHRGPPGSRVERVETIPADPSLSGAAFVIARWRE